MDWKEIALKADVAGLTMPFLKKVESKAALYDLVKVLLAEITIVLFCTSNRK
ncbi:MULTISPECIES: hypothetical protein [unclassified Nodularia (in: cyanobacteria)]|uniref:hypothetical protein n=1 Tax=Nodularia sp. LEGE 04288 TaxID=1828639 RepID=UPI0018820993|nr:MULTISPECIES: hypothetical protein [unclassified Nodularia (in: cyanobacteria)]MBE9199506.1 hypothetical protein [Nodularia sp. LEGE 06071]MCC2691319.1 hypothetical protein [Nodularia sp. LEGE 04288]